MDDILKLAKDYSKKRHLDLLPHGNNNILENLDFIYDENWENQGVPYPYEILTYLFDSYYTSRCNNFHGNVAARMNSINANKDTFKMYTDMFLTEYIILAIHLNSQGALSDMVLNKVKENANLMV